MCAMHFKCFSLLVIGVSVCLLVPQGIDAKKKTVESVEVTTQVDLDNESTTMTEIQTDTTKASLDVAKKKVMSEDDEDDEEGEDGDGEEEACDNRLSSIMRNFNSTPFLPDDYEEVYEGVSKMDLINRKYNITDMMTIVQRAVDYMTKISGNKDLSDSGMYISSVMMDRMYEAKVSAECIADLANIGQGLRSSQLWPAKFVDSIGSFLPTGLLRGHISSFGEYDQCLSIKSPMQENGRRIYGKYCQMQARSIIPQVNVWTPQTEKIFRSNSYMAQAVDLMGREANMDKFLDDGDVVRMLKEMLNWVDKDVCFFHIGLCVPSTCSSNELEMIINQMVYPLIQLPFRVHYCETHEDITETKLEKVQWFAIICLGSVSSLILLCTLYHIYLLSVKDPKTMKEIALISSQNDGNNNKDSSSMKGQSMTLCLNLAEPQSPLRPVRSIAQQFVLAFSVVENTNKLCALNKRSAPLNGLQLVMTFFIFASQAFTFPFMFTPQMLRSIVDTVPYELLNSKAYWFARTPSVWIDGFMLVLGIVTIQSQFGRLRATQGRFGYFEYIWKRWYRLSVAMFGVILLIFLFPLVGNGPLWYINKDWLWPSCTTPSSLMSTFLYYSNWNPTFNNYTIANKFNICNPPSWLFSVSTQLYLFAPVLFIPLYRWPRLGVSVTLLVLLVSPLFTLAPRILTGSATFLEWTRFTSLTQIFRSFHQYHSNTLQYVTSLVIGLLTGFLIESKPKLKFGGKVMRVVFFILSAISVVLTFVWNSTFWKFNRDNSEYGALAWFVSSKFMFSGALAYVAYMCCTGRGGIINRMLSCPVLQSIGKLSYGIYLLSAITILNRITPTRHTYEMHYYQTLQNTVIDFILTTVLAYILYLLFEGPSTSIMEIFEGDQLFKGTKLESTESVEELKPSDSSGHSSDSEKSTKKNISTSANP